jgi:hypothetical protein
MKHDWVFGRASGSLPIRPVLAMNRGVSAVHTVFLIGIASDVGRLPVLSVSVSPDECMYSIWLELS